MSGLLPATRPLSSSYGPDLENDAPVEDPDRELDASNINKMKADLAYVGRTTPLLVLYVTNNGATATVVTALGPEGFDVGSITINRIGAGIVDLDMLSTGLTFAFAQVSAEATTGTQRGATWQKAGDVFTVTTWNNAAGLTDENFVITLW